MSSHTIKFKVPASRIMYGMVALFLAGEVVWIVLYAKWLVNIMSTLDFLVMLLIPIGWSVALLFSVKSTFFNYHELTDKNLIVSVPPRKIRVPLDEIIELQANAGQIKTDFGKSEWKKIEHDKGVHGKGRIWTKFESYGTRVQQFGDLKKIQAVFSDKNLVFIKARNMEITINVPDAEEFVKETLEAMHACSL